MVAKRLQRSPGGKEDASTEFVLSPIDTTHKLDFSLVPHSEPPPCLRQFRLSPDFNWTRIHKGPQFSPNNHEYPTQP